MNALSILLLVAKKNETAPKPYINPTFELVNVFGTMVPRWVPVAVVLVAVVVLFYLAARYDDPWRFS